MSTRYVVALGIACATILACGEGEPRGSMAYDLLLTGGTVVDGTGAARATADVAIATSAALSRFCGVAG